MTGPWDSCIIVVIKDGVRYQLHGLYDDWNPTETHWNKGIMRILKDTLVLVGIWLVIMLSTTQAMGLWSVVIH